MTSFVSTPADDEKQEFDFPYSAYRSPSRRDLRKEREQNHLSPEARSRVDGIFAYGLNDLSAEFRERHKELLRHERLYGYECWKPHLMRKALNQIEDGDFLLYLDSDTRVPTLVRDLLKLPDEFGQDVLGYNLSYHGAEEYRWTKRDLMIALGADIPKYAKSLQMEARQILFRKSRYAEDFLDQWSGCYISHPELVMDLPSKTPNYPGFQENRHGQSCYSILYKKAGLKQLNIHEWAFPLLAVKPDKLKHTQKIAHILFSGRILSAASLCVPRWYPRTHKTCRRIWRMLKPLWRAKEPPPPKPE